MNLHLIILWLVFLLLALAGVAAVLVWALRTRQFSRQDRARHLALCSGIPKDLPKGQTPQPSADTTGARKES